MKKIVSILRSISLKSDLEPPTSNLQMDNLGQGFDLEEDEKGEEKWMKKQW